MLNYFKVIGALVCFLFILSGCGNTPTHTITGFNCSGASVGSPIVIFGTGFDSNASSNSVAFTWAGMTTPLTPSQATTANATQLGVTIPSGVPTGSVVILTSTDGGPQVTSPSFTVLPQPTFLPASGPVGTVITITGTNFDSTTPANNLVTFYGSAQAVSASSSTSTTLTVLVPADAKTGVITVDVDGETYILTSAAATPFTVTTP